MYFKVESECFERINHYGDRYIGDLNEDGNSHGYRYKFIL
jgi:hypothetical protein